MISIRYNLRNLCVRWASTLMTVLGTGLVVWASVLTFGLIDGLEHTLRVTGDPLDLIVLRKGSNEETSSTLTPQAANDLPNLPGIQINLANQPLCSTEFVTILTKPRRANGGTTNLIVRGIDPVGRALRPDFRIVRGRDVVPGVNEAITSESMAKRFENLALGERLEINKVEFTVVGYFTAGGSSAESEVWIDRRDLTTARRTPDAVSVVGLRATDEVALTNLIQQISTDEQFRLNAMREVEYYQKQMQSSAFIRIVGTIVAAFLTIGAMFAAVANRAREIGTLRALGFPRRSILTSFLLESVLLCLLGGIVGCLATLPFHGLSTGTLNFTTFSEITFAFRFGWPVLLRGIVLSLIMGTVGGLFPAVRAVRMHVVDALRQV
ncbi:MAG: ABC transporter permease [Planctomycetota bacterium]|nr:ABC transporter permease [Planctomycetota bacterium]